MTLAEAKDVATIVGVAVALATLLKGVWEYTQQGAQKRADHFQVLRRKLKDNEQFKAICALLETDDDGLRRIDFADKRDFLGFFEEVALMLNTRLLSRRVAHYMFGYYAILCWKSENFWHGVNRNSLYWSVFADFVKQMTDVEQSFRFRRRYFRL
jgi:hypothetical protein